jgi:anthranilate synthase component 1
MSNYNETAFLEDAIHFRTIPIVQSYFVDTLTPIQIFQAFKKDAVYLLESNEEQSPWSNYSFIGLNPFITIEDHEGKLQVLNKQQEILYETKMLQEAIQFVKELLNVKDVESDIPFRGGAVGYIGYDAITSIEKVPKHPSNDLQLKNYHLLYCETIIAFSHSTKEITFIHFSHLHGQETTEEKIECYNEASKLVDEYFNELTRCQYNHEPL